ncbi:ABC transporter permease [Niabella sp. W65]|nr:ABC transporter permease [Niabella sp. W65]MCH7367412.1 ABC transporter permease [Niabella sp. W65]
MSNTTLLSVFILAPLIYAIFIGFTYRQGKVVDIPVIVVDYDRTPASTQLTEMLNDNTTIKVLQYSIKPANIKDEIIRKNAAALVVIPERFEAMMLQGKYPEVNTYVNTSNLLTANFASKSIQTVLGTYSAGAEMKALQKEACLLKRPAPGMSRLRPIILPCLIPQATIWFLCGRLLWQ